MPRTTRCRPGAVFAHMIYAAACGIVSDTPYRLWCRKQPDWLPRALKCGSRASKGLMSTGKVVGLSASARARKNSESGGDSVMLRPAKYPWRRGAHEGDQRHRVLLAQVAQHVIGPHLGAGVQRIGEDVGEEEDVNGQWSMVNGQWSMVNGQWSTVNGQLGNGGIGEWGNW